MPELRQNIATKEWVIIASERAKRPLDFKAEEPAVKAEPQHDPRCPFCVGNEELDLETARWPAQGAWQVRVVHNKYPALAREGNLYRNFEGLQRNIAGIGHHEIVIEHPHHNTAWPLMESYEIQFTLEAFLQRGWQIVQDSQVEQILFFKNHGVEAGASLKHPHSQIIALPIVSGHLRQRNGDALRYFDDTGDNVFQVMLAQELKEQSRLVTVSEHFVAFIPYAAQVPFHIWIIPRRQSVSFLYTQPEEIEDLARVLRDVLRRLYFGLNNPSYNFVIRTAPVKEMGNGYLHWYVSIIPRLSKTAGFELGSGMHINPARNKRGVFAATQGIKYITTIERSSQ